MPQLASRAQHHSDSRVPPRIRFQGPAPIGVGGLAPIGVRGLAPRHSHGTQPHIGFRGQAPCWSQEALRASNSVAQPHIAV